MKKSLIALAALAATGAFAQSSVTLYGIVEIGADIGFNRKIESVQSTLFTNNVLTATPGAFVATGVTLSPATLNAAGAVTYATPAAANGTGVVRTLSETKNGLRVQDGNDQGSGTSRVGFRGTEDLGGGLKANFQLEMGIRADEGCVTNGSGNVCSSGASGGNLFGRNAWGGISGSFGEVRLGRQVLPSFSVQAKSWSAGSSNGFYDAGSTSAPAMGGVRFSNAIRYMTPNMSGFVANLTLAAPETEGPTTTSNNTQLFGAAAGTVTTTGAARRTGVDLALEYANGPAYIGFGYNVRDGVNTSSSGLIAPLAGSGTVATTPGKISAYTLGGSYDFGVVQPFINYTRQNTKSDRTEAFTPVPGGFAAAVGFNGDESVRAWSIGLRAPVGPVTVIAGLGTARTSGTFTTTGNQSVLGGNQINTLVVRNEQRRNTLQLGAQYALSKRTLLEANYGYNRLSNDTDEANVANFAVANGVRATRLTDRSSAINVGLRHSF